MIEDKWATMAKVYEAITGFFVLAGIAFIPFDLIGGIGIMLLGVAVNILLGG